MMEPPGQLLRREHMRMPRMGAVFPVMNVLNISNEVFSMDRNFRPKGAVRRMQMVIETIKLQIEENTDDRELSLDDLECADWRGLPDRIKAKAKTITRGKNPDETFWEGDGDEFLTLPQLKFANIRTEPESSQKDASLIVEKEENISLNPNCVSDESYIDLDEDDTTIDLNNSYNDEIESISSNSSFTVPSPKKLHYHYKDHPKPTRRVSQGIKDEEDHPKPTRRVSGGTKNKEDHLLSPLRLPWETENKEGPLLSPLRLSGELKTKVDNHLPSPRLYDEFKNKGGHSLSTRLSGEPKNKEDHHLPTPRLYDEPKYKEDHRLRTPRLYDEFKNKEDHSLPTCISAKPKNKEGYHLPTPRLYDEPKTKQNHTLPTLCLPEETKNKEDHPIPTIRHSGETKHKVLRPRIHFSTNPTFSGVKVSKPPVAPPSSEISSEPQKKRKRSKLDPSSSLQPREHFKGVNGGMCSVPMLKPRGYFGMFVTVQKMIPIPPIYAPR